MWWNSSVFIVTYYPTVSSMFFLLFLFVAFRKNRNVFSFIFSYTNIDCHFGFLFRLRSFSRSPSSSSSFSSAACASSLVHFALIFFVFFLFMRLNLFIFDIFLRASLPPSPPFYEKRMCCVPWTSDQSYRFWWLFVAVVVCVAVDRIQLLSLYFCIPVRCFRYSMYRTTFSMKYSSVCLCGTAAMVPGPVYLHTFLYSQFYSIHRARAHHQIAISSFKFIKRKIILSFCWWPEQTTHVRV